MTRVESTIRGLLVFGAAWQLLWLLGDSSLRRALVAAPADPASVLIFGAIAAWLVVVVSLYGPRRSMRRAARALTVAMALAAVGGLVLLVYSTSGLDGWFVGASVVNLAAGLAGLVLTRRSGFVVVALIVVVETCVVVAVHFGSDQTRPLAVELIYPLYALALGMASIGARSALIESARRQDRSTNALARQQAALARSEGEDASVSAAETRLHETVLNTLTAIVRGGFGEDPDTRLRLRQRAAESAEVLRLISDGSDISARWTGDLRIDLAGAIVDLENVGMAVELRGVLDLGDERVSVAATNMAAVGSAVREALINVLRHSEATTVIVHGAVKRSRGAHVWRVQVKDNGRGINPRVSGFGIQSIIGDGIASIGGRADVGRRRSGGTQVTIDVPLGASITDLIEDPVSPVRAVGAPVVFAFSAFTIFSIGATWTYVTHPVPNAVAATIFLGVSGLLTFVAMSGRYFRTPWWVALIVWVAVPVMTEMESRASAVANPTGDWSSEIGSAFLFIIVATGPWWAGIGALVSWLIAQELRPIELLQPGTIVIVVAMVMSWQLRRSERVEQEAEAEASEERIALAESQRNLADARRRYADVDNEGVIALLESVAGDELDPTDPAVRETCLREERLIRSVLRLHPERIMLHRDLVRLAVVARDVGVDLSVGATDQVPQSATLTVIHDAEALLRAAESESQARVTLSCEKTECVFRLVVAVSPERLDHIPAGTDVLDRVEGVVVLEERWSAFASEASLHAPLSGT